MLISCGQNREWQKIYSTALTCCHQANMLTTAELQQHHLDAWDCFHPSAPKIWIALVIVTVNMSRDLRHHGEPAASLQHGPPREPQWVCAPRRRQTPNSHQTSPYSDSCCNWGKSATVWMDFSFKISALPVSVLVTLLKSQQHMYYSRIAKVLKPKCISPFPGPDGLFHVHLHLHLGHLTDAVVQKWLTIST